MIDRVLLEKGNENREYFPYINYILDHCTAKQFLNLAEDCNFVFHIMDILKVLKYHVDDWNGRMMRGNDINQHRQRI